MYVTTISLSFSLQYESRERGSRNGEDNNLMTEYAERTHTYSHILVENYGIITIIVVKSTAFIQKFLAFMCVYVYGLNIWSLKWVWCSTVVVSGSLVIIVMHRPSL